MNTRHKVSRIGIALAGVLALGLTACASDGASDTTVDVNGGESAAPAEGGTLERLQEEGKVVLAVADERPYSWVEGGEPMGATVAMHKEIFAGLGIDEIEVVEVDWNSLIPGLNAGRFDAVSAGMSILPDRCEQAAFSDPEIMYTTTLMVAEGNPKGVQNLDDVAASDGDVKLATLSGGIEEGYADALGITDTIKVDNAQAGMEVVQSGRADAFAMTAISLNWMVENASNPGVETTEAFVQELDGVAQIGAGSTVFRQDDTDLLEAYNAELAKITADSDTYLSFVGEYGFTAENLPPADLTTEQLCAGDLG
ncbi:MAG TPA: ectoine/hydroxyectoine ABC transporter substrate-binding protein EhuB [Microbacteriaceae bacterium]|nr:ectoine/hydroxyectoine ABC transporter substrate-binding protein EhuB [Microbacteriaceae bacterium]